MKNQKFVVGLLLSSVFIPCAHAASPSPVQEASRAAFPVTGGSSVVFQHGIAPQFPAAAGQLAVEKPAPLTTLPINNLLSFVTLPTAFHYLEGGANTVQGMRAQTTMAQQNAAVEDVTEPASELLLLAGLSALAIAIRRQSPS